MARERKPLIEPGSVLPPADTLSRILERDRLASGRKPLEASPPSETAPLENRGTPPSEVPESTAAHNITSNITAHTRSKEDEQQGSKEVRKPSARKSAQAASKPDAQMLAQQLAATRAIPITLRLPEGLNDWLDDYAHEHRKHGVKKQDLVARAVELLVITLSAQKEANQEAM